jgi:hypothetical protein
MEHERRPLCFNDCIYDLSTGEFQETHDQGITLTATLHKNDFDKELLRTPKTR